MNLVFKGFLHTSIPPLNSIFCAKEGLSRFSVEIVLPHSAKKMWGNLSVFQKISGIKKFYAKERGGSITILSRKISCLTVPKHFVEERFCVPECLGYRNILCMRGGREGVSRFSVGKFIVSQYRKTSQGNTYVFHKIWYGKIL